jgi:ATP-binding cassette, subfamily C, bacterial CydD
VPEKDTLDTDPSANKRHEESHHHWLNRLAPVWLRPAAVVLAVVEAALIIAQAGLLAWIIHAAVILGQTLSQLWSLLLALLAVFFLRAVLIGTRGLVSAGASARVRQHLRERLFDHLCTLGQPLIKRLGGGELVIRLADRTERTDAYFARYLPQLATVAIVPPAIIIAVAIHNWLAALLLGVTAPLIPVFMALVGMGAEQLSNRQQQALGRLGGVFLDRLHGLDTIRRFGAEQRELSRLAGFSEQFRQRTMAVLRLAFLSSAVLEFFAAVAIAALAIYIGLGLLGYIHFGPATTLTLGSGLFILLLAPEFFAPLRLLAQYWHDRADALAAAAGVRELLALPAARPVGIAGQSRIPDRACPVTIRDLEFGWPDRDRLIRGLDLDVAAGEHILITGPSGCGKSTLISLLAGFLVPASGRIRFADIDQAELDQTGLARVRSWLGQHPVLFAGSIADNIALGDRHATRDRIEQAANLTQVSEFSRLLPLGLDTPVGQDGFGFSGGQAQRIALARALLQPRPLLLLDEPTANLDHNSEQKIWSAIDQVTGKRAVTVICTSHSPLARAWADRILLMDQGCLIEVDR